MIRIIKYIAVIIFALAGMFAAIINPENVPPQYQTEALQDFETAITVMVISLIVVAITAIPDIKNKRK